MQGEQGRGGHGAAGQFGRRLADLKRNGCNVLLVGTDALDAGCERLLGESSAGPRYRLFVTTDAGPASARARLAGVQSGPYRDSAAVVDWRADGRAAGEAGDRESDGRAFRVTSVESDDLGDLSRAVEAAVESFAAEAGELSPAELRLCVDSLAPLVEASDERTLRRLLLALIETVERVDGMGHYHLPGGYDSASVATVEALFDAVVELRRVESRVEQRWHLLDPDLTTRWLAL
ncbi:DUF7504 family protein [Halorussus halobius]|uniref:DUF7504 family protein n=1 Tax=Halorussus halobius TaxID=1710537 RepID=UPI001092F71E|nr:hypothetical protein [Halorussus halobius]